MTSSSILILGGGCFGLTAAIELRARGWEVTLIDQGKIPHPDAASTDISKVVRMDYGADAQFTVMGEASIAGWRDWNLKWGESLYHEDGLLVMSPGPMQAGTFEGDSHALLTARGHVLRRTSAAQLQGNHPAWDANCFCDGYLNPIGGWVESGRVVARLAAEVRAMGVVIVENVPAPRPTFEGSRCTGIESVDGSRWRAEFSLLAAGDSGHGFKFAPVIGGVIADVVEQRPNAWAPRFRWREKPAGHVGGSRA